MRDREGLEIELKCLVAPQSVPDLLGHPLLAGAAEKTIRSVYFDTPACAVRAAGFSLRVRHVGARRIQTIKALGRSTGLFARREWVCDLAQDHPTEGSLAGGPLADVSEASRLAPLFEVEVLRSVATCSVPGAVVELAFDRGQVRTTARTTAICEIEFEVKSGPTGAVFDLAAQIAWVVPLWPSRESKADLGYGLLAEDAGAKPASPGAVPPGLDLARGLAAIERIRADHLA